MKSEAKSKAPANRTMQIEDSERGDLLKLVDSIDQGSDAQSKTLNSQILQGDTLEILPQLEKESFDLLICDPPYNLRKQFGTRVFKEQNLHTYIDWLDSWIRLIPPLMKPNASLYFCGDWKCSQALFEVINRYFEIQNRITWEREKGRGSKKNWKNSSEDIWFCTMGKDYTFNADAVKLKRKVLAPYKKDGKAKDWNENEEGKFRLTYASNLWNDITIPFWSMPENTDHPTQKPEKLIAKLILASSNAQDNILDPFGGSGTTLAVAQKLNRFCTIIEREEEYCLLSAKRFKLAQENPEIQGYENGVFKERNSK